MKTIITMIALIFSAASANASFFQTECSDAYQNVKYNFGQMNNKVILKSSDFEGEPVETSYWLTEVDVETKDKNTLRSSESRQCSESGGGVLYRSSTQVLDVVITKADGSEFPEKTKGLSEDNKSISATVLCEHSANYMASCSQ